MVAPARHAFLASACWFLAFVGVAAGQQNVPPVQLAPPGDTGRRVTEDGLLANYFPAQPKAPALLTLAVRLAGYRCR